MIPMEHHWTDWQIDTLGEKNPWKWKENTPKEIVEQYEEWEKYYNEMMKIKFQHLLKKYVFLL